MFYSQTYLAPKGPLGTVWRAAHLQHKLKRSHYTATNIKSVVDQIISPAAPLALRLSGHLLLGVARIYSKQVEYLFHDCNLLKIGLKKALTSVQLNLDENDRTAKFESITLPQTFNLDALEIEDDFCFDRSPDIHLRSREEITLVDQIPTGQDPFVAITFDEDFTVGTSHPELATGLGNGPSVDEIIIPSSASVDYNETETEKQVSDTDTSNQNEVLTQVVVESQDVGPSNRSEVPVTGAEGLQDVTISDHMDVLTEILDSNQSNETMIIDSRVTDDDNIPEPEIMRDSVHSPVRLPHLSPIGEKDATTVRSETVSRENEITIPIPDEPFRSGGPSFQLRPHSEPQNSAGSGPTAHLVDTNRSPGETTPGLAHVATTPVQQQQQKPQPRQRKRKRNNFDHATVLTNKFVKKGLEDCSDLLRKRKNAPSSALGIWKLNKKLRKEQVFHEPLLTGLSSELSNLFADDHNYMNHHLIPQERDIAEPSGQASPVTATTVDVNPEPIAEPSGQASPVTATTVVVNADLIAEPRNQASPVTATTVDVNPEPIAEPRSQSSPVAAPAVDVNPEPTRASSPPGTEAISHRNVTSSDPVVDTTFEPTVENFSVPEDMDIDADPEHIRDGESHLDHDIQSELFESMPLHRRDDSTPSPQHHPESTKMHRTGITDGTACPTSVGTYSSGLFTPRTNDNQFLEEDTQLSNILELMGNEEFEVRGSPEADNTPSGSSSRQGSRGAHQLSGRTRAVAEYLERQTPMTPTLEDAVKEISLNKMLEGKTRKLCARMFYETLVLKSHGAVEVEREEPRSNIRLKIDVEQKEAYGDITLKLSRLGK